MTTPPLPASPCVRCRIIGNINAVGDWGSRFYLSYSGSAPSGANCTTLAGDIHTAWAAHLAPLAHTAVNFTEVDVLDIATNSGLSGQWTGSDAGTASGGQMPAQTAVDCEYGIARRYRGGKPRMFLPPTVDSNLADTAHYSSAFITSVNSAVTAFFAAIEALSVGSMGTLAHVNLSYYHGFTNITNSSGRERAVPTYRPTALLDAVTGYSGKLLVGSQKRRRQATSP